ncbi:LOW QUALITY PROTEIN: major royal jelly protein 1-like [Mycetomoellerius zeteki]|uniref:LOW QUALITY PROTEIN: major royal jelly protein 1-like n=1 Tax=Mycetomoellerius zeteki TaxID=64791 RepID=UPI00084E5F2A|nr:PREDICTED: LOW QUALITY PROTEIN: major royal jelly protein 1-like [Trachymyrmex zeteki]
MHEAMDYDFRNIILFDVDKAPDGRIFVTAVRDKGVPASLMTISNERGPGGPLLSPYPNWSWYNDTTDCDNNIISIKCNRLFILDFGIKNGFEGERVCPQKLLIFDLEYDMPVENIRIPSHIANNKNGIGLLATVVADVQDCSRIDDATVSMADVAGYGLVTYNRHSGFCRIESDFMKPTHPYFTIENESFYLEDGILGLTTINKNLLYAPLAGNRIFKMNKHTLKKCSKLSNSKANKLTKVAGILSGQTGPIASYGNVIFFSNIPETSILCADTTKKFDPSSSMVIAQDSEKLQFPSGMKAITDIEKVLVLTNRFQHDLTFNETNFRILSLNKEEIEKANCFVSNHHGHKRGYYNTLEFN